MSTSIRLAILGFCAFAAAACCDENVRVVVLAGRQEARACMEAVREGKSAPLTVVCGGKEVTICWASNVQDVTIEPLGITSHGSPMGDNFVGIEHFAPTSSGKVTVTASDCAAASQDVTVISGDTPVTFDGGWTDQRCSLIDHTFDPLFVDADARSISVTALWNPIVPDANGNPVLCKTPPFLSGFKKPELFGFNVDEPFLTKAFSQPVGLAGDWQFAPEFQCPPGNYVCDTNAPLPFSTTVRCPAP
jgi:hypothetical protein